MSVTHSDVSPPEPDGPPRGGSGGWLHNFGMSSQRRVLIHAKNSRQHCGHVIEFRLQGWTDRTAESLLALLKRRHVTRSADVEELSRELDDLARELPLPPAVVVSTESPVSDATCACPLVTAAVLCKTGQHIYLRDKLPRLDGSRDAVVLLVPEKKVIQKLMRFIDKRTQPGTRSRKAKKS